MAQWEYKLVVRQAGEHLNDDQLNVMGGHGYELVTVQAVAEQVTVVGRHETHVSMHYFFKRPKAAAPAQAKPAAVKT